MHKQKRLYLGLLLLAGGGMLYALFRSRQTLLLQLADATPLRDFLSHLRASCSICHPADWVIYSLPGGLWSAAYILVTDALMRPLGRSQCWRWASVIPLLGAISELGQALHLVPGTFDVADLVSYLLPLFIYTASLKHNYVRHEQ